MSEAPTRDRLAVLPPRQRAGVVAVHLAAVAALAAAWSGPLPTRGEWLAFTVLACLGALAALDVVSLLSDRDNPATVSGVEIDITDVFFVAAVLLLPLPLVALVSAPAFLVEQVRYRRPLYRLTANAAAFVVMLVLAAAVFRLLVGDAAGRPATVPWLSAAAVALAVHVVASGAWLLYARWVMRRIRPAFSVLRETYPLASELTTKSVGVLLAALWLLGPVLCLLAVAPVLVLHRLLYFRHVQESARRDGKTGLYHAGWFRDVGARYVDRAVRQAAPLSLVLVDLDHLRDLNNSYGHLAGDVVIEGVADLVQNSVRDGDIACRFGGEEFAVLLPGADLAVAMRVAERIRRRVAATPFVVGPGHCVTVTLSSGLASVSDDVTTLNDLVRAADGALYDAKRGGRNRSMAARSMAG